jgi:Intrinsic membrane protein PufX
MADEQYFTITRRAQLTTWIAAQMLRGAGWAALVVVGFGLVIAVLWFVGSFLPEDSKLAPDPNTWDTEDRGEP